MNSPPDAKMDAPSTGKDPVASISGQIRHLGNGDRSSLRRLDMNRSAQAEGVIIGLMARAGLPVSTMDQDEIDRWAVLIQSAALLSASGGGHSPDRPFGRALRKAGFSEARLVQMVGSPDPRRIIRAVRFLASQGGGPVDLRSIVTVLDPDQNVRTPTVRAIVRDYHSARERKQDTNA